MQDQKNQNIAVGAAVPSSPTLASTVQQLNALSGVVRFLSAELYVVLGYAWVPVLLTPAFISFPTRSTQAFAFLFIFRYLRLALNILGNLFHKSIQPSGHLTGKDATVIVPTVDPANPEFVQTIALCVAAGVRAVVICTVGDEKLAQVNAWLGDFDNHGVKITAIATQQANKRRQLRAAMPHVETEFVVFCDDHVFWPAGYLEQLLAPFVNPAVGGVCTQKRVRRDRSRGMFSAADFGNFIGCLYLERHNFDLAGSNGVDGAVFVISGRTAAYRTALVNTETFLEHFCNEIWLHGRVGPLNPDDDNCITRHLVRGGHRIQFQRGAAATMETTMGIDGGWAKLHQQLLRWARTTFRSNYTSLLVDRAVYRTQPVSVYTVYIALVLNFALYVDAALLCLAHASGVVSVSAIAGWILATKMVKPLPHLLREPRDVVYIPGYILFGYWHSIIKTQALLTVTNVGWGSRPGVVN